MVKCAGCGKEFNPPEAHWRYCYECWMKGGRKKFFERRETERQRNLKGETEQ